MTAISPVVASILTEAVEAELGSGIASDYAPAITKIGEALTERAYLATDHLISLATNELGLGEDEAREYIERTGLPVRPKPEPVVEEVPEAPAVDVEDLSDADRIRLLEEGQRKQGESLGKLLELADKIGTHLGLND